ncbi:hypothetical protein JAAARDRAFT_155953 [Jaapia argillacea MUCL 33604]|uniref:Glycoside hydrolase family 105 protein n=1 Tax=Jaapia argillacea MUCL 33604 TaxID=933084 RepID=A0A067PWK2_9AGAM|nr:hypothetical protein JAAARDRAFT_155953 [Jaapia argillacea MUCL 33604]
MTVIRIMSTIISFLLFSLILPVSSQNLTGDQIATVKSNLANGAKQSWEIGTRAQALLEYDSPQFSVFSSEKLPLQSSIFSSSVPGSLGEVLAIAQSTLSSLGGVGTSPQPLVPNDAVAGDPASIGVAVLLANWTGDGSSNNTNAQYGQAATNQLDFLYTDVPRTSDGAISHRTDQLQLWSDFVYMVPPFLAYYGVTSGNRTVVEEAYNQVKLYRNYLRDASAGGLWKHVVLGSGQDLGHWSTGNGWAAAGMLRVLATIQRSSFANGMKNEQIDLANWVREIHGAMYSHLQPNNLFKNYADSNTSFDDAASTALLAATVYRLANLWGTHTYIPEAERCRQTLSAPANSSMPNNGSPLAHFTQDMWLTPVVDPYNVGQQGTQSPESLAFVIEMQSAWRDWIQSGSKGANGGGRIFGNVQWKLVVGAVLVVVGALAAV